MLSDEQFAALMTDVHREIDQAADEAIAALGADGRADLVYPPGMALSDEEQRALAAVEPSPALRKLIADAAAKPLFRLFAMLDGIGDPEGIDGDWPVWELVESEEGELFYENWLGGRRD
jgi:hypothetical protein